MASLLAVATGTALVESAVLYPLDFCTTRMQVRPDYVVPRGPWRLLRSAPVRRRCFRGVLPHLAAVTAVQVPRYLVATTSSAVPVDDTGRLALQGALAGAAEAIVITPLDAFKIPMQVGSPGLSANDIYATATRGPEREWSRLWRGHLYTTLRQSTYGAVTFTSVGLLRRFYPEELTGPELVLFGCLTGAVASVLGSPFDVLKSRAQAAEYVVPNTVASSRDLFRGLSSRLWRVGLGTALAMVVSDEVSRWLRRPAG
ncbi:unnamed protein product (mitochondrion) [Plasmodiophora brassicae]|uniref:Mitochondrial carrier protein n=1 Tax=Plasmodiophora brassicae TaxID=37360 RepID=A0A0G4IHA1_PLABS|nr:hypothetical protein PBRA_000357 [Plasmodiophora brassicae]SPQ96916.1 unnamed protein product [Plasmodiophora brassicae]